jgi:hypothetical protein
MLPPQHVLDSSLWKPYFILMTRISHSVNVLVIGCHLAIIKEAPHAIEYLLLVIVVVVVVVVVVVFCCFVVVFFFCSCSCFCLCYYIYLYNVGYQSKILKNHVITYNYCLHFSMC